MRLMIAIFFLTISAVVKGQGTSSTCPEEYITQKKTDSSCVASYLPRSAVITPAKSASSIGVGIAIAYGIYTIMFIRDIYKRVRGDDRPFGERTNSYSIVLDAILSWVFWGGLARQVSLYGSCGWMYAGSNKELKSQYDKSTSDKPMEVTLLLASLFLFDLLLTRFVQLYYYWPRMFDGEEKDKDKYEVIKALIDPSKDDFSSVCVRMFIKGFWQLMGLATSFLYPIACSGSDLDECVTTLDDISCVQSVRNSAKTVQAGLLLASLALFLIAFCLWQHGKDEDEEKDHSAGIAICLFIGLVLPMIAGILALVYKLNHSISLDVNLEISTPPYSAAGLVTLMLINLILRGFVALLRYFSGKCCKNAVGSA